MYETLAVINAKFLAWVAQYETVLTCLRVFSITILYPGAVGKLEFLVITHFSVAHFSEIFKNKEDNS